METTTINNINDFAKVMLCDSVEDLVKYFSEYTVYPVEIEYTDKSVTLRTDADRVPFTKVLWFPFTEDDYEDAIIGLQCVTDYAMHEGYDHTHEDLFKSLALRYAENHGIYEYQVNGSYMEYWSLYNEGFYFYRVDLNTNGKSQVCHLEWHKEDGYPIPAFLKTPEGFLKYNYFEG